MSVSVYVFVYIVCLPACSPARLFLSERVRECVSLSFCLFYKCVAFAVVVVVVVWGGGCLFACMHVCLYVPICAYVCVCVCVCVCVK